LAKIRNSIKEEISPNLKQALNATNLPIHSQTLKINERKTKCRGERSHVLLYNKNDILFLSFLSYGTSLLCISPFNTQHQRIYILSSKKERRI
jgi:hypothetical protein